MTKTREQARVASARYRAKNAAKIAEKARALRQTEEMQRYQREWARRPEVKARRAAYYRNTAKPLKRAYKIKTKYGLTVTQFNNIVESQEGRCPGCGDVLMVDHRRTHIDHDHSRTREQGNIRGVLCVHCNHILGAAKDRQDVLLNLVSYLNRRPCGP